MYFVAFQDDIRRVKRGLETSGKEKCGLTSKIEELELYNNSSQRELKNLINTKEVNNDASLLLIKTDINCHKCMKLDKYLQFATFIAHTRL